MSGGFGDVAVAALTAMYLAPVLAAFGIIAFFVIGGIWMWLAVPVEILSAAGFAAALHLYKQGLRAMTTLAVTSTYRFKEEP